MEPIRGWKRCWHRQGKQSVGSALMLTSLTTSASAPFAQGTRPFCQLSQCFPETSLMAHDRRSQLTTSITKVKSTCSSAICLACTPSYPNSHPNLPIPCPKSYKNSSPSTDCTVSSTQTKALHLCVTNSPQSCSHIT